MTLHGTGFEFGFTITCKFGTSSLRSHANFNWSDSAMPPAAYLSEGAARCSVPSSLTAGHEQVFSDNMSAATDRTLYGDALVTNEMLQLTAFGSPGAYLLPRLQRNESICHFSLRFWLSMPRPSSCHDDPFICKGQGVHLSFGPVVLAAGPNINSGEGLHVSLVSTSMRLLLVTLDGEPVGRPIRSHYHDLSPPPPTHLHHHSCRERRTDRDRERQRDRERRCYPRI